MAQIVLVDDDKVARALYSDFLTGAGHLVVAVASASEALETLSSSKVDAVTTDLILPHSDGLELLQSVKTNWPDVAVLVITSLDKVEPAVRAIKSGASDYLVKPVAPEVLAHAVNRALAQRGLLRENEDLRRNLALLEAGQRIATTLDRDRLVEATGSAFSTIGHASAVVVFFRGEHGVEAAGAWGVDEDRRQELLSAVHKPVATVVAKVDRAGSELEVELMRPWQRAFLLPVYEQDTLLGAVLLLFEQEISKPGVAAIPYLTSHLALALKNLGRFSEVEDLVYLDDLTHLFNRRYLELVLDKDFRNRKPTDKPLSLLFLDLDYFKSVNDTHGHLVGSKLLVEVSRILKAAVRDNDVVCRWGGDEYVILLRSTDSGGALKVGERIRRGIEAHRFLAREGYGLHITTCVGIASCPEHASDKESLVDLSDRAMYRGKKGTRNIIYVASRGQEPTPPARRERVQP